MIISTLFYIGFYILINISTTQCDAGKRDPERETCHISGKKVKTNYSTKTPYQFIVNQFKVSDHRFLEESECENLQYWSIIRHGTRYPSKKAINLINKDAIDFRDKIVNNINTKLCSKDLELFNAWEANIDIEQAKNLHREGVEELIFMGERLYDRYPDLFHHYHEQDFLFRSTNEQRSVLSFESLALGLFSRLEANRVKLEDPVLPHDPLIRFYKLCDKWITSVKKNESAKPEYFKFIASDFVKVVRENITSLLGLKQLISYTELETIYLTCNFDQAWSPRQPSPWCGLFTDKGLEVMEYIEDLEYYWIDGPGYPVSYQPACLLISDVYHNFLNITLGGREREERGIFYFTHSGTILKFLAFLQTHTDDQHLRSDNFIEMLERKWRTSKIGPFAANISFLLQKCGLGGHLVCLYVNEELVALPGCGGDGCCPWDTFVSIYREHVENCDFDKFCAGTSGDKLDANAVPDDRY